MTHTLDKDLTSLHTMILPKPSSMDLNNALCTRISHSIASEQGTHFITNEFQERALDMKN
jgi:hypothetical protein